MIEGLVGNEDLLNLLTAPISSPLSAASASLLDPSSSKWPHYCWTGTLITHCSFSRVLEKFSPLSEVKSLKVHGPHCCGLTIRLSIKFWSPNPCWYGGIVQFTACQILSYQRISNTTSSIGPNHQWSCGTCYTFTLGWSVNNFRKILSYNLYTIPSSRSSF
jgi:hypothetical protein